MTQAQQEAIQEIYGIVMAQWNMPDLGRNVVDMVARMNQLLESSGLIDPATGKVKEDPRDLVQLKNRLGIYLFALRAIAGNSSDERAITLATDAMNATGPPADPCDPATGKPEHVYARNLVQELYEYFQGPHACGDFTCDCNNCGLCEFRTRVENWLLSNPSADPCDKCARIEKWWIQEGRMLGQYALLFKAKVDALPEISSVEWQDMLVPHTIEMERKYGKLRAAAQSFISVLDRGLPVTCHTAEKSIEALREALEE